MGYETKPVLIGPYTFLKLARNSEAQELDIDEGLIDAVAGVYAQVVRRFADLGAQWLQLDEPYLVMDKSDADVRLFKALYSRILPAREDRVKILLNTYFGNIADIYETVKLFEFDGVGLDLVEGRDENLAAVHQHGVAARTTLFAGVVNGRNIWRNNYATSIGLRREPRRGAPAWRRRTHHAVRRRGQRPQHLAQQLRHQHRPGRRPAPNDRPCGRGLRRFAAACAVQHAG